MLKLIHCAVSVMTLVWCVSCARTTTTTTTTTATRTTTTPANPNKQQEGPPTVEVISKALDVPYVPTPPDIVAKMLELAKPGKTDVLYDLGSGDGRIVIAAAKDYGVQGFGYDLNPQRIRESNENARKAGVSDRVQFLEQDLFEVDLSKANVVTLYLLPEVNARLLPKFKKELKPGTRVVSHNYPIGNWEPHKVVEMNISGVDHYVYYWVVGRASK